MIELRGLTVRFDGAYAVRDVSFKVETGEWVVLIGPNGAGKTSALRAICRLLPFGGRVLLDGLDTNRLGRREVARIAAFVPQAPETPPELTVGEYVLLGRADRFAAERALHRLELGSFAERTLGSLSGGELQRAVIARALAQESPILLLDEPTTALDLGRQQQALELIDSLRSEGLTVVSTMHDLTLAGQYADRLLLLDRGAVVAEGPAAEVLIEPNVASYYGANVRVVQDEGGIFVLPLRR